MAHFLCVCGEDIPLHEMPHPQQFRLMADKVVEKVVDRLLIVYEQSVSSNDFLRAAVLALHNWNKALGTSGVVEVIECPKCGRLAFLDNKGQAALWYKLDTDVTLQQIRSLRELTDTLEAATTIRLDKSDV